MFELMSRLNPLLADWKLDVAAAASMNDAEFTDYLRRHEEFMKSVSLIHVGSKDKPAAKGCALVYGEFYYLDERLMQLTERFSWDECSGCPVFQHDDDYDARIR